MRRRIELVTMSFQTKKILSLALFLHLVPGLRITITSKTESLSIGFVAPYSKLIQQKVVEVMQFEVRGILRRVVEM